MKRLSLLSRIFGGLFFKRDKIQPRAYPLDLADYERRPLSDNPTVRAVDIPKAFTPEGLYPKGEFPEAILAESDEALSPHAPDLRGVWYCISGRMEGHVERIERKDLLRSGPKLGNNRDLFQATTVGSGGLA